MTSHSYQAAYTSASTSDPTFACFLDQLSMALEQHSYSVGD